MSGEGQDDQLDDNASQFGGPGAPTPLGQLEVLPPSSLHLSWRNTAHLMLIY